MGVTAPLDVNSRRGGRSGTLLYSSVVWLIGLVLAPCPAPAITPGRPCCLGRRLHVEWLSRQGECACPLGPQRASLVRAIAAAPDVLICAVGWVAGTRGRGPGLPV